MDRLVLAHWLDYGGVVLIGRDAERAVVGALLEAARAARSDALVVRGEPGVGKTALLEDAREQAADMQVLSARGVQSESELPFAGLHQLLRPALVLIDALPGPQAAALGGALGLTERSGDERFLVSAACLTLLSEFAEQGPVLCLVDDVQWLDTPSTDTLLFVSRRLDAEGIVVVFAAREGEARRFDARGVPELELPELDVESATSLLVQRADGALAPSVRDELVAQAGGNALALVELAAALSPSQLVGDESLPDALPMTERLAGLYLARVRQLPKPAQRLLLVAAADDSNQLASIVRAANLLGIAHDAVDLAEASGLVRVHNARIEFHHPLVRTSIYQGAEPGERRAAHKALAAATSETPDADRRAWHLAAAATGPDADIADALEATAERARARSGYSAAAAALERASDLSADSPSSARRLVTAAAAAWHAGQPERALTFLDRARRDAIDPRAIIASEHIRGTVQFWCGRLPDACQTLMAAAERAAEINPRTAAELLFDAAGAAAWAGDFARVREAASRAEALPRRGDDEYTFLVDLLVALGGAWGGHATDMASRIQSVVSRAPESLEPRWLVWAAAGARVAGDDGCGLMLMRRAAELARSSGAVDALTFVLLGQTITGFREGRFGVEVDALEGLALARDAGLSNAATLQLAVLTWLAAVKGDEAACNAGFVEVDRQARSNATVFAGAIANWGVALLDLGQGRLDDATARLDTLRADPSLRHPEVVLTSTPDLVEALIRSDRREHALEALAPLAQFIEAGGPTWAAALAARCRALLADGAESEHEFSDALKLHSESNRAYDRARTALLYGEQLRRDRRRVDAREQLRLAVGTFEQLGAEPWEQRARSELRASGETARKRDPSTVDLLTPQELRIARLVAEGLSNKEVAARLFLSPRTIHYHLRRVFVKLDITSRSQLARLLLRDAEPASISRSAVAESAAAGARQGSDLRTV